MPLFQNESSLNGNTGNTGSFSCKSNWFYNKTRFETEAQSNSEMAHRVIYSKSAVCFFLGDWHCAYVLLYRPRQLEVEDDQ